jgi:outer membrane protein
MQRLRCFVVLFISLCIAFSQETDRAAPNASVLTLDDALAIAMKANRQVQSSELDIQKAAQSTAETRAQRFPQFNTYLLGGSLLNRINFTIPAGTLGVYPGIGPLPSQNSPIQTARQFTALLFGSAAQPISQLYKINLGISESKLGEELARENLRQQKQDIAFQIKDAYYQIVRLQSQIESSEASLKYLTEFVALTGRRLAEEAVLKSESLTAQAKLSQQRYQLFTLRDSLETQKEALNRLLGRDLRTGFSVQPQPPASFEELDLNAAQRKALDQRAEIRKARLQVTKAELEVRRKQADYIPDISVQFSYLSFPNVNLLPRNITHAGFLFQWQPFDWRQKRYRIEQLRTTGKQATLTREDAEQQVLLDVNSKYRKLLEARALLDTQAAVREVERESLRLVMNRFEQKAALVADVLQQQAALTQADKQYDEDLASLWAARAAFVRALGEE